MTELKPCPLGCPKSHIKVYTRKITSEHFEAKLQCNKCDISIVRSGATEECALENAIQAWNTRAERTCQAKPAIGGGWFCSHCGVFIDRHPMANATDRLEARYCPNCGAKVVE